jgi:ubiquinone/menaquinone biosynthesis C-methylase UbiE
MDDQLLGENEMRTEKQESHQKLIMDQFTKQAVPFSEIPGHSNEEATRLFMEMAHLRKEDTVLDVACGPGLLACAIAPYVRHITGIDIVPTMIEKTQKSQQEKKLSNIGWRVGDIQPLPFANSSYSVVVSRYAFHHFLKPAAVLREMMRVAQSGGRVAVIDVFTSSSKQSDAYDRVEKLRDPSHVRALPLAELQEMVSNAGLVHSRTQFYRMEIELEQQLKASFPKEKGDVEKIRQAVIDDTGQDRLGWGAHRKGNDIYLAYPHRYHGRRKTLIERITVLFLTSSFPQQLWKGCGKTCGVMV